MRSIGGTTFDRNTKIMHKRKGEILMRTALSIAASAGGEGAGIQVNRKRMTWKGIFKDPTGVTGTVKTDRKGR